MEIEVSGKPPDVLDDDFKVSTNEDWFRDFTLKNGDDIVPIMQGWKFYMQMQVSDGGILGMTASSDNGRIIVIDASAGRFGLRVRQADAAQLIPAQYKYDIVLVAGDGIYRLVKGVITVDQGITNVPGQEKWVHFPLILRPLV